MRAAGESLQLRANPLEPRVLVLVLVPILLFGRESSGTSGTALWGGTPKPSAMGSKDQRMDIPPKMRDAGRHLHD